MRRSGLQKSISGFLKIEIGDRNRTLVDIASRFVCFSLVVPTIQKAGPGKHARATTRGRFAANRGLQEKYCVRITIQTPREKGTPGEDLATSGHRQGSISGGSLSKQLLSCRFFSRSRRSVFPLGIKNHTFVP
jgi:hypothetical protein